jgi:hypothetical protein
MDARTLQAPLLVGMNVYDAAGDKVGRLVGADAWDLIVEQGVFFPTEFAVPIAAVDRVDADGVWLSLGHDEARRLGEDVPVEALPGDPALALG